MSAVVLLLLAIWQPGASAAQLIPIRTVPVSQAHQFEIFPSHNLAMGGISIAVADSLLDPFYNPAKASRLRTPIFAGSPALYSVSSKAGGGRTLPFGTIAKTGNWFAGALVALQQVDASERLTGFPPPLGPICPRCAQEGIDLSRQDRTHGNQYVFAMAGRELPERGISVGGSVFWAGLNAVDGVDLLYAGSAQIKQFGNAVEARLGVLKEWEGDRSLEVLALHNRFGMTHDVAYLDGFWDPAQQLVLFRPRVEENLDRTNTWGLHLAYDRPLAGQGWRIGWTGTANYKSHPKIPNYEIMNIPRDPGYSGAFNAGVGVGRVLPGSTLGIDLVYEPIWSYTWADTESAIETDRGTTIPAGGKTVENHFRFSNAVLRMGVGEEYELREPGSAIGVQLGLGVRSIRYWLTQHDNVNASSRDQTENWVEWTPTWGLTLRRPSMELRYRGMMVQGTGRPGVGGPPPGIIFTLESAAGSNILVAPSGPLTLDPVRVQAHQVSVSVPIW